MFPSIHLVQAEFIERVLVKPAFGTIIRVKITKMLGKRLLHLLGLLFVLTLKHLDVGLPGI
jgi:hypothetical protein